VDDFLLRIGTMDLPRTASAALLLTLAAGAQCNTVTFANYATTCAYAGQHSAISGTFDSRTCRLTVAFTVSRTCCNTLPFVHALLLGVRPFDPGLPHPLLVPGCILAVDPVVVLGIARSTAPSVTFTLPPLPATHLFAQGVTDYFTTVGMTHELQTSDGLRIDVR